MLNGINSSRVIIVPGINTDNEGSVFKLVPLLERAGLEVVKCTYPHRSFWDTLSKRKSQENARYLRDMVKPGDHGVFHSNGCRTGHQSMELGAQFDQAYMFGAAFGASTPWAKTGANKINVIHNSKDKALMLGSLVPRHDFGMLGMIGYQGPLDLRIHSFSTLGEYAVDKADHSFWDDDRALALCAGYLIERLAQKG